MEPNQKLRAPSQIFIFIQYNFASKTSFLSSVIWLHKIPMSCFGAQFYNLWSMEHPMELIFTIFGKWSVNLGPIECPGGRSAERPPIGVQNTQMERKMSSIERHWQLCLKMTNIFHFSSFIKRLLKTVISTPHTVGGFKLGSSGSKSSIQK